MQNGFSTYMLNLTIRFNPMRMGEVRFYLQLSMIGAVNRSRASLKRNCTSSLTVRLHRQHVSAACIMTVVQRCFCMGHGWVYCLSQPGKPLDLPESLPLAMEFTGSPTPRSVRERKVTSSTMDNLRRCTQRQCDLREEGRTPPIIKLKSMSLPEYRINNHGRSSR